MKHNKCPYCGSEYGYITIVFEREGLCFDFKGEPLGGTEKILIKELKNVECMECHKSFKLNGLKQKQ